MSAFDLDGARPRPKLSERRRVEESKRVVDQARAAANTDRASVKFRGGVPMQRRACFPIRNLICINAHGH